MTKFKVGDKVKVRIDLTPYEVYGGLTFLNNCMSKCAGQICTIKEITINNRYRVNENLFVWSEEMLEPVLPEFVFDAEQAKECADNIMAIAESISCTTGISYENSINKLKACLNAFSNDGISAKNGGKNTMKFTFYVTEGTRVDKSCNGTIPTITTSVVLDKFGVPDFRKCYSLEGKATCDKADYDMRQGVLEALANAVFDGNFEKAYDKAVKANARCERQDRTCYYCGKVFDTVEERAEHEAWHVERRKARHERYLLRKRAKEIAFEEQAQKIAKEMMKEDK